MVSFSFLTEVILLVASCFIFAVAGDASYVAVEKLQNAPVGWLRGPSAPPSKMMKFHIAVRPEKTAEFEQMVLDMSTPGHPNYGQHMKRDEVRDFVRPSDYTMEQVLSWLDSENISKESMKIRGNWVEVTMPVSQAESLMKTRFYRYTHRATRRNTIRTLDYSVPREMRPYIQTIQPTTHFEQPNAQVIHPTFRPISMAPSSSHREPTVDCSSQVTPDCLRELYGLYDTEAKPDPRNRLGISGYLDQYARYSDFHKFMGMFAPNRTDANFTVETISGGLNTQNSSIGSTEASLDVQYAIALAYNPLATYYTTGGRGPFIPEAGESGESESTNEPYLEQLHYLLDLSDDELPAVLSTSYGEAEQSVPVSYSEASCHLFAQLGARGVSILFSSGDDGVGGSCLTNDGTNRTRFQPIFPASCPFVTAVGGTYKTDPEIAIDFSGGGFSDRFKRPAYQDASVGSYLEKLGNKWEGLYNPEGRGIPDVAAQALNYIIVDHGKTYEIGGTSASAPTFAAIVSRLNAERLKDGNPRLGFLNPWLYSLNQTGFTDIVDGHSSGCANSNIGGPDGYATWDATTGWDPATGLGTPFYNTLVKVAREL